MPSITGGSQFDDGYAPADWAQPEPKKEEELPKFDFQNIDVKLYLALKALMTPILTSADIKQQAALEEKAKLALQEFELHAGPLPDWAIARNWDYSLVPGAQLMTKDGRITGNAHVLRQRQVPTMQDEAARYVYDCITDAGSFIKSMYEPELLTLYWVGDFISEPHTLIARFGNHGEDYGLPQQGDHDV